MNSTAASSTLSSGFGLNVTAVDASSSSGAQLTNYTLTTAVVDNRTTVLSGRPSPLQQYQAVTLLCLHATWQYSVPR